jgi:hypothetical protein
MITIDDNINEFRREVARAQRVLSDAVRDGVRNAVTEGAEEARRVHVYKDRSGELTGSIRGYVQVSTPGGAVGVIEATAKHASMVEAGTAPHEIRPRSSGGALRFEVGGQEVFRRVVYHPGTQPHPFMGPAAQKAERVLQRDIEVGIQRASRILEE